MNSGTVPAEQSVRNRCLILGLLFVCRTGLGFQFQTLGSVSSSLVSELGFSYAEIGTLIGLFMLPGLVLALPVGYAGRHASDLSLVVTGLLMLSAGGAIGSIAPGFGLLALGRIAAGAGFVFSTIYFAKMVADWFTGKELATAMGILVMSWPFGIAMGQIGQVWIAAHFDWHLVFLVAALHCMLGAAALALLYRAPHPAKPPPAAGQVGLTRSEFVLTLLAAMVWALFNAGYIVYLSFAPRVLMSGGYEASDAAAVISLASWVMIFSAAICGQIADRTGKRDQIIYVCAVVAVLTLLALRETSMAVALSLLFGLVGAAPAGVIMALTAEAMAPQRRAFGMGVFFSIYFVFLTVAPPIAGWLFDRRGDPFAPIVFAASLFASAAFANWVFRLAQRKLKVS